MHTSQEPDLQEMLCRAKSGDGAALGHLLGLYETYLGLLARLQIGRLLQGKVDAADLVRLEQRLAEELARSSRAMDVALVAPQSSPSQQAARREQAVLLANALQQLPEHYREVIILHHLEGLSLSDVAKRLGRTAGDRCNQRVLR